jgi:hypothetical protein
MNSYPKNQAEWQIVNEKSGRFAMIALVSGEQILISVGTATAKVLIKRPLFGWVFPKTIISERLSVWQPEYPRYNGFNRRRCRSMALEGLLLSLSHCKSVIQIQHAWKTMRNPIAIVGLAMMKESQVEETKDALNQRRALPGHSRNPEL